MKIEEKLLELLDERGYIAMLDYFEDGWQISYSPKSEDVDFFVKFINKQSLLCDQTWLDEPVIDAKEFSTYEKWLKELNTHFVAHYGLTYDDFEDYNWRDEYDSEVPPFDAFDEWKLQTENGTRSAG